MRRFSIVGFIDNNGTAIVLPEYSKKNVFPSLDNKNTEGCGYPAARQRSGRAPQTGGCGTTDTSGLKVIATVSVTAAGNTGTLTIGVLPGDFTEVSLDWSPNPSAGPTFSTNQPVDTKNCFAEAGAAIATTLQAIVSYVRNNPTAFTTQVTEIIDSAFVGEITLAEMGGLLLATLAGSEMLALLAAVGAAAVAVFAIAMYAKCQAGS